MRPLSPQRGFGLVEIMVGLVIGMIASVVIFQVFSVSERQKRTTTGSADAQTTGAFSLYTIERDTKMAGFGLEANAMAACDKVFSYYNDGSGDSTVQGFDIPAAVRISDGGGSNPDQIEIVYYSNPADDNFIIPSNTTLRGTMPDSSAELNVNSTSGCQLNSLVLVQQAGQCTVMQVTQVQAAALKIQHNPGGAGTPANPTYNPKIPYMTTNNWPAYTTGAAVRCGLTPPVSRTYRLNGPPVSAVPPPPPSSPLQLKQPPNSLVSWDSTSPDVLQTISPNIVALQAQYGVADAGGLIVNRADQWVDATGIWKNDPAASTPTRTNGKRIKAIRVAMVARSSEYEKPEPGNACATTTDAMVAGWSAWANLSAVKTLADWQCYRYKVVETVIPLRNVIWANVK